MNHSLALRFEVSFRTAVALHDFSRDHDGVLVASNVIQFFSGADSDEVPYLIGEYNELLTSFGFEPIGCQVIHFA